MGSRIVIILSVAVAIIVGMVLLAVMYNLDFSGRSITASLLIHSFAVFLVGAFLYTGRAIWKWPAGQTPRYLFWERGIVIAALLELVLGLTLLQDILNSAENAGFARVGLVSFLMGAIVVMVAETSFLATHNWVYPQVVFYVVLAFLAQAAFGIALIQTDFIAEWVGWVTIVWNLAWLAILPIFSPREIYFPVLHHVAPLIIGIALLV